MVISLRRSAGDALRELKAANSAILREDIANRSPTFRALPEIVTLNHTDKCNLRCVMCPRNLAQGKHRLERRVLARVTEALLPTAHKLILTAAGGEPILNDFDFLLEAAIEHQTRLDVVTNGMLLTPEVYQRARETFDHLNVSLDSHVPEVYERIRVGGRFATVDSNLRAIRAQRTRAPDDVLFSLSAVVMRSTLPHLAGLVEYAAGLGADAVLLQKMQHIGKATPEEDPAIHCSEGEIETALAAARESAKRHGTNLFLAEFGQPAEMVKPIRAKRPNPLEGQDLCWFLAQNFNVMYTGEVYACCVPNDHIFGDVHYEEPAAIWNGKAIQKVRAAHFSGCGTTFCSGCQYAPHLPARKPEVLNRTTRRTRMLIAHARNRLRRALRARYRDTPFGEDSGNEKLQ